MGEIHNGEENLPILNRKSGARFHNLPAPQHPSDILRQAVIKKPPGVVPVHMVVLHIAREAEDLENNTNPVKLKNDDFF
jgi:hypothetical protein